MTRAAKTSGHPYASAMSTIEVSSVSGSLTINGTAGNGTGGANAGVVVDNGAAVTSTGAAVVTLTMNF